MSDVLERLREGIRGAEIWEKGLGDEWRGVTLDLSMDAARELLRLAEVGEMVERMPANGALYRMVSYAEDHPLYWNLAIPDEEPAIDIVDKDLTAALRAARLGKEEKDAN